MGILLQLLEKQDFQKKKVVMTVADYWGTADLVSLIKMIKQMAIKKQKTMVNVISFLSIQEHEHEKEQKQVQEQEVYSTVPCRPPPPVLLAGLGLQLDKKQEQEPKSTSP